MGDLDIFSVTMLFLLPLLFIFITNKLFFSTTHHHAPTTNPRLPNCFPIIGYYFALRNHTKDWLIWLAPMLHASPTSNLVIQKPLFGGEQIVTADPANVEHILKTKFDLYEKGDMFTTNLRELLGYGIFNVDHDEWKFQRHIASYEFNSKSLRKFVEQVVYTELEQRLIPILAESADKGTVLDLQELLKRFTFDNMCEIAFGYDSALLLPSLPKSKYVNAFEDAVSISGKRFRTVHPIIWQTKRFLNIGYERQLRKAMNEVHDFSAKIVKQKKQQMNNESKNSSPESNSNLDLLSRFLKSGHSDEKFLIDIVNGFLLAGRDTSSSGLTWFFWLLSKNPAVEREIVDEIRHMDEDPNKSTYDHTKDLVYTHAALHESMRLYPPVIANQKQVSRNNGDDVWPDGTVVRKGSTVMYHIYAMGRSEKIWGKDWPEFRPERWLEEREEGGERRKVFKAKDQYSYPIFQAGPRICLGKEMALLQMKMVVAGVLRLFRVVPVASEGFEPVVLSEITSKMEGGFWVRFERRV